MAHDYESQEHEHKHNHQEHSEPPEELRVEKPGMNLFNVVESVILAMSVGLMLWVANLVVEHGKILSSHETLLKVDDARISSLEDRGSPSLTAHVREDAADMTALRGRLDKVESAILALQATPGELKAISVRLEGIKETQARMEKTLDTVVSKP